MSHIVSAFAVAFTTTSLSDRNSSSNCYYNTRIICTSYCRKMAALFELHLLLASEAITTPVWVIKVLFQSNMKNKGENNQIQLTKSIILISKIDKEILHPFC